MAVFYVSPTGSGTMDGSSAENAGSLRDVPAFVAASGPGGEVRLLADKGSYQVDEMPLVLTNGGDDGNPLWIHGVDSNGNAMKAEIVGTRVDPYVTGGNIGSEVFRLIGGADNLTFTDLGFKNVGSGAIRVGADIKNLTIEHITADNVYRFFENYVSGEEVTATISGLTIRDVEVDGFSKGVIRLRYDTHDVLIEDVKGDSEFQNGDNFAIGIHIDGTAHNIVVRRSQMSNTLDNTDGSYWNGDGFATERDAYNILFEDTLASHNSDGGYDIKSQATVLMRTIAEGNGRNYRLWATDTVLQDAVSLDPYLQGGSSSQNHFWLAKNARATITGVHVSDVDRDSTIFNLQEGGATLTISDLTVTVNPDSIWFRKGTKSVLTITSQDRGIDVSTLSDPHVLAKSTNDIYLYTSDLDSRIVSGFGDDVLRGSSGRDILEGGAGEDLLIGGEGDDLLDGGAGADLLIGGKGFDVADYSSATRAIVVDLGGGAPLGGASGDLLINIEGVFGSAFDDRIFGNDAANLLKGGAGADQLIGRSGDDFLEGGAGADLIDGGDGQDIASYTDSDSAVSIDLETGTGSGGSADGDVLRSIEIVIGSDYNDTLKGGDGNDILDGGLGSDILIGGAGIDTADYSRSNAAVSVDLRNNVNHSGNAQGDILSGIENVRGSDFADTLTGDDNANRIEGGLGADTIVSGGGDDVLVGEGGADILTGGAGVDTADYSENSTGVVIDLAQGTGSGGDAGGDRLSQIERVIGSKYGDILIGDDGDNILEGGLGSDWLLGGLGADRLIGGEGLDFADYSASLSGVALDLRVGVGTGGDAAGDTLTDIEAVLGSQHDDLIFLGGAVAIAFGGLGNDSLIGSAGNDLLDGGAGADTLTGGDGLDTVTYAGSASSVTIDLTTGTGLGGDAQGDSLVSIERIIGSAHADVLIGNDEANVFVGTAGADVISGGSHIDTVDYSSSIAAVTVDLAQKTGTGGDAQGDSLSDIEKIIGTAFADTIIGNGADNIFVGGAGADRMDGGAGNDTTDYSLSLAGVTINLATAIASGGDAEGDLLTSIENIVGSAFLDKLTGNIAANRLDGGMGNDTLDGGAGDDLLIGGLGSDFYYVDSIGDVVIEQAGSGTDRIVTTLATYTIGKNVEEVSYIGTGNSTTYGNDLKNVFLGAAGSDTAYGFAGNDKFIGSLGTDFFYGGDGEDLVDYSKATTAITVNLSTNVHAGNLVQGDLLYSVEDVSASNYGDDLTGDDSGNLFYGRGGNDIIRGLGGNDILDGGDGGDTLYGGTGDDVYVISNIADVAIELVGEGIDSVKTGLSYFVLADNIENLRHASTKAFTGIGNGRDNVITGGSVSDMLYGMDGNDTLIGGGGNDKLDGGAGIDTADYSASLYNVTIKLGVSPAVGGDAQGDQLISIENLVGSRFADRLTGDANANRLLGGGGADVIEGGGGADDIDGGSGTDIFVLTGAFTDYRFVVGNGVIHVTDLRSGAPDGVDSLTGIERIKFSDTELSLSTVIGAQQLPPDYVQLSATDIPENSVSGRLVGHAVGHDPNTADTIVYSLTDNAGGRFAIDAQTGDITVLNGSLLDFETASSHDITIRITDPVGQWLDTTIALTVRDVNEAPTSVALINGHIAENAVPGVVAAALVAADPDANDILAYSLIDDAGGRFVVDSVSGIVTVANPDMLDFETAASHDIIARIIDSAGNILDKRLTIAVTGTNEAPLAIALSNRSVAENSASGTVVGTAAGSDPDAGDVLHYSLVDNAGGRFSINSTSGVITVAQAGIMDYETAANHGITVRITDGVGHSFDQSFIISVTDVNEGPGPLQSTGGTIAENPAAGTLVASVSSAGASNYALLDDAAGLFVINAATGEIRVAHGAMLDYEAIRSFALTVSASNAGGSSTPLGLTVSLTNIVENQTVNGTDNNDTLIFTSSDNWTVGGMAGNDRIVTLDGLDRIRGGSGDDDISAGGGDDILYFTNQNNGYDKIDGGAGFDSLIADQNNATIGLTWLSGIERISGGGKSGIFIKGSAGNDYLDFTSVTIDRVTKGIDAGAGNDVVLGSLQDNAISGGDGMDIVSGGLGIDTLTGAGGADSFLFRFLSDSSTGNGVDTITDFVRGIDTIDVAQIDARTNVVGDQSFSFIGSGPFTAIAGQLQAIMGATSTSIRADVNGDGVSDMEILLLGRINLTQADFML